MTLIISKSQNLTKDPEQSPNPYLRPLRKKKEKNSKTQNSLVTDEAVIVNLSHCCPMEGKNNYTFKKTKKFTGKQTKERKCK